MYYSYKKYKFDYLKNRDKINFKKIEIENKTFNLGPKIRFETSPKKGPKTKY